MRSEPMRATGFQTEAGMPVPSVTAKQMREADRVASQDFGLSILQMMENAGRSLAQLIVEMLGDDGGPVIILAGSGGNGGGGICAARHLRNHNIQVDLALSKSPNKLSEAPAKQLQVLTHSGLRILAESELNKSLQESKYVIDALIGYSLSDPPTGRVAEMINSANSVHEKVISLDLPSGIDATTGGRPGAAVQAATILTLALPKTGLLDLDATLHLADIGIPAEVFHALGIQMPSIFGDRFIVPLARRPSGEAGEGSM